MEEGETRGKSESNVSAWVRGKVPIGYIKWSWTDLGDAVPWFGRGVEGRRLGILLEARCVIGAVKV